MGKRICILEDDEDIRTVIGLILTAENYEVSDFATVKEFMNAETHSSPDLFLLDIMLPDGNGLHVCEALKQSSKTQHTPVLMMSAHATEKQVGQHCTADGFIQKPFDIDVLVEKVRSAIH